MKVKSAKYIIPFLALAFLTGCGQTGTTTEETTTSETTVDTTTEESSEEVDTRLAISFEGNDVAYAIGLPELAEAGETVSFKVAAKSGYEITAVEAETEAVEVTLAGSIDEGFTFVMPEDAVEITATALGAYFKVACDPAVEVFKPEWSTASVKKNSDFIAGFMSEGEGVVTGQKAFMRAGEKVNVLVNTIATATDVVVKVNGVAATYEAVEVKNDEGEVTNTYNTYAFVMPNKNVEVEVSCEEALIPVTVEANEHYVAEVLEKDEDGEYVPATAVKGGHTVYVRAAVKPGEEEQYFIKGASMSYSTYSGYSLKASAPSSSMATAVSGEEMMWSYTVTTFTNYAGGLEFKLDLKENVYAGKEFVGTFKGCNFYGSSAFTGSTTFVISGDGSFTKSGSSVGALSELDETNKTLQIGTNAGWKLHYDTNIIWYTYGSSATSATNDIYLAVKDYSSDTMDVAKVGAMNKQLCVLTFTDKADSQQVANFARVNGTNYLNVTFEFVGAKQEVAEDASFYVIKNGERVAEWNIPEDTPSDISYLNGTWKNGSNTMVLDATAKTGTWNGIAFTFTFDANTKQGIIAPFGAFDGSENTLKYNDDGTITVHLDDEYYENTVIQTLTKQA